MDCQVTLKSRTITCKYFDLCHQLQVCLCEVEPYDDGTKSPLNLRHRRPTSTPWPIRRQQILEFARGKDAFTTTDIMEFTSAARVTTCNWLHRLTGTGDLHRLTKAILSGPSSSPATFAIAHNKEKT